MAIAIAQSQPHNSPVEARAKEPLPLETGDHLTRPEFERRYAAMPNVKKAELIEGIVYMPSPVSANHSEPHAALVGVLFAYVASTPGARVGDNGTVRLDMDNEPQPDAALYILRQNGGQASIDDDGYVSGAPELVAEIANSSASIDLHAKLCAYQRNGVLEYVVVLTRTQEVRWHVMRDGAFMVEEPDSEGVFRSEAFPGLSIHSGALLSGNATLLMEQLNRSLQTEEHSAFVKQLADTRVG